MNKVIILGFAASCLTLLAGCQSSFGFFLLLVFLLFLVESTDKFVLLDKYSQSAVTCTGLQERVTPESLVEVAANVKNRDTRPIQVQVCCIFKNQDAPAPQPGAEIPSDQTPWQNVALDANATETVRFVSPKAQDRGYSIHVRQAR